MGRGVQYSVHNSTLRSTVQFKTWAGLLTLSSGRVSVGEPVAWGEEGGVGRDKEGGVGRDKEGGGIRSVKECRPLTV